MKANVNLETIRRGAVDFLKTIKELQEFIVKLRDENEQLVKRIETLEKKIDTFYEWADQIEECIKK